MKLVIRESKLLDCTGTRPRFVGDVSRHPEAIVILQLNILVWLFDFQGNALHTVTAICVSCCIA